MNGQRNYGWIPDLPDQRDLMYGAVRRIPAKLPAKVDLRKWCSARKDQETLGACTANGLAAQLEFLSIKAGRAATPMSRLFIYYNERALEGTVPVDRGAYPRDGIKTLAKQGAAVESLWPYATAKFALSPPQAAYRDGLKRRISTYQRLLSLQEVKACLASGFPVGFGFTVYESFESRAVAETGMVPMPKKGERALGGHYVYTCGYDDATKLFVVPNSWGVGWGDHGDCYMPYAYLDSRNLSDDFWTIRAGSGL